MSTQRESLGDLDWVNVFGRPNVVVVVALRIVLVAVAAARWGNKADGGNV